MNYDEKEVVVKLSEALPIAIEAVIDARYKYLKELDYENHSFANKILKEEYDPAVLFLKKIVDQIV